METIKKNRNDLFELMRRMEVFTAQTLIQEFSKNRASLQVDTRQTIKGLLEELCSIGALHRQNDMYMFPQLV
ncbi:hypothetical protein HN858_03175 [Candidatus Falkowbacteria bacterium]|nr:hypothetical protein [Candidatus Falkowbacteria bacterium]MBT5503108.1 hypothetical protein [Candidatus Falkowbacteria bacterium]MBT6574202.1 hypothetical protein [Candidatus Falkowbacteria bacterium]MBT7348651.1 hypothetical protein [Candidatus Falkowbacteria bacterium]MBT7500441.1 hypothetical protein [Candidatus Falkowbacteria bacterium]